MFAAVIAGSNLILWHGERNADMQTDELYRQHPLCLFPQALETLLDSEPRLAGFAEAFAADAAAPPAFIEGSARRSWWAAGIGINAAVVVGEQAILAINAVAIVGPES